MMITLEDKFISAIDVMPVVAIIRGVKVEEVVDISNAIYEAGVSVIEVPLNTPNAFDCIAKLTANLKDKCFVGCGTLVDTADIPKLVDVGAELAVTPTTQPDVIEGCVEAGLLPMPGFVTPTEAFSAVKAGARHLKLFPASTTGPDHIKRIKDVLPKEVEVYAVGGVKRDEIEAWQSVGTRGFGFGSDIFSPGLSAEEVHERALKVVKAVGAVYGG